MENILSKAITLALKAHEGQVDKSGIPYAGHIMRVMAAGRTIDEKIVGVMHDVVEDTDWTFEALLAEGFPVHIVDALRCVTKLTDDEPYDEFIDRVKTNPLAIAVKINDLTDNMDVRRYKELSDWDVKRLRKYLKAYQELTKQTEFVVADNRVTPECIDSLGENEIFVFGCRNSGRHFDGASNFALKHFGAVMGQREGRHGQYF